MTARSHQVILQSLAKSTTAFELLLTLAVPHSVCGPWLGQLCH